MTNIQAAEVLRDIKQSLKESMDETVDEQYKDSLLGDIIKAVFEEKYEALDMAINALKSEPMMNNKLQGDEIAETVQSRLFDFRRQL